ncbi:serine/threonine-protein kinase [Thalassoroseus pseudoceratinae]|uniref:serine/threonine-protein kinase n=1 Tax=Thalassoroseus pseudoceratinae TaxID=2713176 RepID=UPI001424A569|nr:serine/threonine-protein kinase [Thalassoroseus pseudoceratinae]
MLKSRQRLGKYRIEQRLADGGFGAVFRAMDTIEGIRVAIKVPHQHVLNDDVLEDFRREVRLTARLDHNNILSLKNASFIDDYFVIVFPLGEKSLADRLRSRMSLKTVLELSDQMIEAVAYAHRQKIIHCDIKPENFILFPGNRVRLTDFGIAKVAQKTIKASGSGTVGYMSPEQAMGKPSSRSDVFSLGLCIYRMLTGNLPEYPFDWPPPGFTALRRRVHADLLQVLKKSMELDPKSRYRDADQMLRIFRPAARKSLALATTRRATARKSAVSRAR